MFIILGLLLAGIAAGYAFSGRKVFKALDQSTSWTIYAMLLIFGITIGANKDLVAKIGQYGVQAAVIAIAAVLGSVVASAVAWRIYVRKGGRLEK